MRNTILYLVGAAALYYYLMNRKKKTGTSAMSAQDAGSTARRMVADIVDNTTFLPDQTTMRDQYNKDKKLCR